MSLKKLLQQIREGRGQGHGSQYRTFLPIRRRNPSPTSNQVVAWLPPLGRSAHFFSHGEFKKGLLFLWLGVRDLREGYPLWPVPHPHPLTGAPGTESYQLPWSRGLLDIARDAGIDHGNVIGTRVPYVATMDFVATVQIHDELRLAAFSSKPIDSADEEVKWRTLERLELERRYMSELPIPYHVVASSLVPNMMAGQLEVWLEASCLEPSLSRLVGYFLDVFLRMEDVAIVDAVRHAARKMRLQEDIAWILFRHCAWTQAIDIDPSVEALTSRPPTKGGRALRTSIQNQLFGEGFHD